MAKLKFEQQRRINMEKTKAIISTDDKLANAVQVKKGKFGSSNCRNNRS